MERLSQNIAQLQLVIDPQQVTTRGLQRVTGVAENIEKYKKVLSNCPILCENARIMDERRITAATVESSRFAQTVDLYV